MLEKTEGVLKYGHSRDTDNIKNKTQNEDIQKKQPQQKAQNK